MKTPSHSIPVLAYYQPFGPEEHTCSVVASWMELGPQAEGRWLIAESQEWLPHTVVSWTPIPPMPTPPDGAPNYAALTAEAGMTCESLYYIRNEIVSEISDSKTVTGLDANMRETLIVSLNQLAYEARTMADLLVICRN